MDHPDSLSPVPRASSAAPDIAVIGGGLIGLAVARRAALRGTSVTVFDPVPGRGASWVGAGMLAPVTEVHYGEEVLLRLNLAASGAYPDFVSELEDATGHSVGYRRCGTLMVARDTDDKAALEDLFSFQTELGLGVERLTARECRKYEPALSPRTRAGIFVAGDHQVDTRALVRALLAACESAGARFERSTVTEIFSEGGRASSLVDDRGERTSFGAAVLAAGARSTELLGLAAAGMPRVRPVKGQLLHLRSPEPLVNGNLRGLDVYLVGRADGRLVVGATVEEQGFDTRITAGAMRDLLQWAYELVPGLTELEVVETIAGSRPTTPDNAPLIGKTALDGLFAATGHYRNGVLLAPSTADAVVSEIVDGDVHEIARPFSPTRFANAGQGNIGSASRRAGRR